jgi:hypothetical protein
MTGRAISRIEMSKKKRNAFIASLAETGQVTTAAKAVGYATTQHLHKLRREDEDFATAWDEALMSAGDLLKDEAVRRARDGVLEPDYYKGDIVGYTVKYSDSLLMFIIKQNDPTYRDTGRGGGVNINFGVAIMPMQAKSDEAWESRALEMHDGQELIILEEKPKENLMLRAKVTRSD